MQASLLRTHGDIYRTLRCAGLPYVGLKAQVDSVTEHEIERHHKVTFSVDIKRGMVANLARKVLT